MSYHDRRLLARKRRKDHKRGDAWRLMIEGASTITLWPTVPQLELGSVEDDWRAVGNDIRRAMNQYSYGD